MKKSSFKSIISLALSLALMFSAMSIFSTFTASATVATDSKTFGFENTVLTSNGYANSLFTKSNEEHRTGDYSMRINWSKAVTDESAFHSAKLNEWGSDVFNVTSGQRYKVTFYYKVVGSYSVPYQFELLTNKNDSFLNGTNKKVQTLVDTLSFPTTSTDDWVKFETSFTSNIANEESNTIGVGVRFPKMTEGEAKDYSIYIDDFTIEKTDQKVFDFEKTVFGSGGVANSAFAISKEHGDTAMGNSLKIERKVDTSNAETMGALLTTVNKDTGEKYNVQWGKKYKVTFKYKTVGTAPSDAWKIGLFTCATVYGRTLQDISNPLYLPTTATDGWLKYETTFTATSETGKEKNTLLGICVTFSEFKAYTDDYKVFIDNLTVEETDTLIAKSMTFNFGNTKYGNNDATKNSAFEVVNNIYRGDAKQGHSLQIYKDKTSAGRHSALLTDYTRDLGVKYNVSWGKTYKVTLWYKTEGTVPGGNAWKFNMYTGKLTEFITGKYQTKQEISNPLSFLTEATNEWVRYETYFTARQEDGKSNEDNYLGVAVEFPEFSDNTDYKVYIDDVTVSEMLTGDVNCDGEINSNDLALLRMALLGIDVNAYNCNVNDDTVVDIRDLVALKKIFTEINQ